MYWHFPGLFFPSPSTKNINNVVVHPSCISTRQASVGSCRSRLFRLLRHARQDRRSVECALNVLYHSPPLSFRFTISSSALSLVVPNRWIMDFEKRERRDRFVMGLCWVEFYLFCYFFLYSVLSFILVRIFFLNLLWIERTLPCGARFQHVERQKKKKVQTTTATTE